MIDGIPLARLVQQQAGCAPTAMVDRNTRVALLFELNWRSAQASHCDCLFLRGISLWQDQFPRALEEALYGMGAGERVTVDFTSGGLTPAFDRDDRFEVEAQRFSAPPYRNQPILPALGRFYPKRFIAGVKGIDARDIMPMRVVGVDPGLTVDLNHPLAANNMSLTAGVIDVATAARSIVGDVCRDIGEEVTGNGPGMQARCDDRPTDFWHGESFARSDQSPDSEFYGPPRLVSHIDRNASAVIGELYRQWVPANARVLDLMASWESHLPDTLSLSHLSGLGMNAEELARNARMADYVVQDLNRDP